MKRSLFVLFLFPSLAFGQITQAQMQQAVEDAITATFYSAPASFNNAWINSVPFAYPGFSSLTLGELIAYGFGGDPNSYTQNQITEDVRSLLVLSGSFSNLLHSIEQSVSANLDSPMSDLQSTTDVIAADTANMCSLLFSISSDVGALVSSFSTLQSSLDDMSDILISMRDVLSTNDSETASAISDLQDSLSGIGDDILNTYDYVASIYTVVDDSYMKLYEIANATQDTADSAGAIVNWLETQLDQALISAIATGVANIGPLSVDVTSISSNAFPDTMSVDGMSDLLSAVTGIGGNLAAVLPEVAITASNTTDIADTLGTFFDQATNFYGGFVMSPVQEDFTVFTTNMVATNAVAVETVSQEEVDSYTNQITTRLFDEVFDRSDDYVSNPYDGGEAVHENLQDSAEELFSPGESASSTSDLVLMGSNDVDLPRISVQLENVLPSSWERNLESFMVLVWRFIGAAFRIGLLGSWLIWYSQKEKRA